MGEVMSVCPSVHLLASFWMILIKLNIGGLHLKSSGKFSSDPYLHNIMWHSNHTSQRQFIIWKIGTEGTIQITLRPTTFTLCSFWYGKYLTKHKEK
jgi:hypothetical protein